MRIGSPLSCHGTKLISAVAVIAFLGIAAAKAETAWLNYQLRARIAKSVANAGAAANIVTENAARGKPLDFGWRPTNQSKAGEHIAISRETGIVIVSLSDEVGVEMGNLKLVPTDEQGFVKLTDGQVAGKLDLSKVNWVCTSRDARYYFAIPAYGYGSLPSRLAPADCR